MKLQWYIVYTQNRAEKKVFEFFARKKIECYFPLNRVIKNHNISNNITNEPLFASYIFVKVTERQLLEVRKASGVVSLVCWLGKPVIINELEINSIKRFLNDHINVSVEKIMPGNLIINREEIAEEDSQRQMMHKKVSVALPSIGYIITAEVETANIRIISSNNLIHQTRSGSAKLFNPMYTFYNFLKN
ncbi:MAG: transcription termination/antitermination NusG family protein [Ginsengibacter sp.]